MAATHNFRNQIVFQRCRIAVLEEAEKMRRELSHAIGKDCAPLLRMRIDPLASFEPYCRRATVRPSFDYRRPTIGNSTKLGLSGVCHTRWVTLRKSPGFAKKMLGTNV